MITIHVRKCRGVRLPRGVATIHATTPPINTTPCRAASRRAATGVPLACLRPKLPSRYDNTVGLAVGIGRLPLDAIGSAVPEGAAGGMKLRHPGSDIP